jgi:hypothetical protein
VKEDEILQIIETRHFFTAMVLRSICSLVFIVTVQINPNQHYKFEVLYVYGCGVAKQGYGAAEHWCDVGR